MRFQDRVTAGRMLAQRLGPYAPGTAVVLGLPRGGLPVGRQVARALGAPLDVLVAKKIGAPGNPEFAIGAVTARGSRVLNRNALSWLPVPPGYVEDESQALETQARRREAFFRDGRAPVPLTGKTVIVVDDGIATGMTILAALEDVRRQGPAKLVVAAPIIAPDTYRRLAQVADAVVAVTMPENFIAIGQFYDDFTQVTDDEAKACLSDEGPHAMAG